ncbi:5114_t:CDS:1 [Diversispora eburnea]|uniref:5114_t:CDS:1 n=1 Tax=Diversispora eburnea TaxID=1213867 RepID=A0A9N8ZDM1_9GLOM|nr:5114_t:CDS:1 [Diversispora eburnea]
MASGPVGGGFIRHRRLWRFFSVDPEIYPLIGLLSVMFASAGYMMGRKATNNEENNILKASQAYPWQHINEEGRPGDGRNHEGKDYKYRYHANSDPSQPTYTAPSAVNEHRIRLRLSKDVAEKLPKSMVVD